MKLYQFIKDRWSSIRYAVEGLGFLARSEANFRIHLAAAALAIIAALCTGISSTEWLILLFLIALIFSLEAMNTALEKLVDKIEPGWNTGAKRIKDMSAAAVLIMSLAALIVALLIFLPKWI